MLAVCMVLCLQNFKNSSVVVSKIFEPCIPLAVLTEVTNVPRINSSEHSSNFFGKLSSLTSELRFDTNNSTQQIQQNKEHNSKCRRFHLHRATLVLRAGARLCRHDRRLGLHMFPAPGSRFLHESHTHIRTYTQNKQRDNTHPNTQTYEHKRTLFQYTTYIDFGTSRSHNTNCGV